jgi:hypothetical protein
MIGKSTRHRAYLEPELRNRAIFVGIAPADQIITPPMASRSSGGTNFGVAINHIPERRTALAIKISHIKCK